MKFAKIRLPEVDEIIKVIDKSFEKEQKHCKISAAMANASTAFVTSIIKTADKYGEDREVLLQTAVMGVLQSLFDVNWSTFDPETGIFKEMK